MAIVRKMPDTFIGYIEYMVEMTDRLVNEKASFLSVQALAFHKAANKTYRHVLEIHKRFSHESAQ